MHTNQPQINVLSPASPTAKAFVKLFPHRWDFIESEASRVNWRTVNRYYLQSLILWQRYCDPDILLGVRFGRETSYGMFDIDIHSLYHPYNDEQAFKNLLRVLEEHGLCKYIIVRSSDSEGLHIYFFFPEPLNSFKVACALKYAVMQEGYKVQQGILEIFPNPKQYAKKGFSHYNGHRLPLQKDSFLLDDDYQPYSNSIETFVRLAHETAAQQDIETFKSLLPMARQWFTDTKGQYINKGSVSHTAARWRADTEYLIAEGWTGYGQTNEMLKEIGKYGRVFLGLAGDDLWQKMLEIAQGCPGYETWCRHQHEIEERCRSWARIIEPYWIPLYSDPERQETYGQMMERGIKAAANDINKERNQNATERIIAAVKHIVEECQELPIRVTQWLKALQEATKKLFGITVSEATLRRRENLPYWHPKHRDWTEDLEVITIPPDVLRGSDTGELPPESDESQNTEAQTPDVSLNETITPTPDPAPQKSEQIPQKYTTDIIRTEVRPEEPQDFYARPPLVTQPRNEKLGKIAPQARETEKGLESSPDQQDSDLRQTPPYMKGLCVPDLSGGSLESEDQVSGDPKPIEQPESPKQPYRAF